MPHCDPLLVSFFFVTGFAISTQIVNPFLMTQEPRTQWYAGIPWYKQENNVYYFVRNGLISTGNISLQVFCIFFTVQLSSRLSKREDHSLQRIKVRIILLSVIVETFLVTELLIIWLQNLWWYKNGPALWIACNSLSTIATVVVPVASFSFLVLEQIVSMHRKLSLKAKAGDSFLKSTLISE